MFRDTMPCITFYRRIQKTYFCNYIRYSENGHEKKENVVENENKIRPDVFVWKKKGTANEVPKFYDSSDCPGFCVSLRGNDSRIAELAL